MDGEHRGDLLVPRNAGVDDLQVGRHQPGLPVVGVQHVDGQVQQADGLQDGAREKDEAFAIIDIILAVGAVELIAVEVLVLVDEIDRDLAAGHGAPREVPADHLAADGHDEIEAQRLDRLAAVAGLPIGGHDHGGLVPQPRQLDGQGAAHVGQSAGFRKRDRFARGQ